MLQDSLGMRLRQAYLTLHRRANAHFEPLGATADQFVMLTILAEKEGLTQREIVARAASDPNTVGEMLLRLERKKLVRRRPHPHDGRARCVYLTAQGRKFQQLLFDSWQAPLDDIDACFQANELDQLKSLLARMPAAVEKSASNSEEEVA